MSKKKAEPSLHHQAVIERRRSSAAGSHGYHKRSAKVDRATKRREAIKEAKEA